MATEQTVQSLWEHRSRGDCFPAEWQGKLDKDEAYRVQLGLLDRKIGAGERQAGWKVGLTAQGLRVAFGSPEPVFGHLLQSARKTSGHAFAWSDLEKAAVESELLIMLARDLSGPSVTADDARAAVASIAPALEIVDLGRADMKADLPLTVADNVMQYAFVAGVAVALGNLDFGSVRAQVTIDSEVVADVVGRDVIDNQMETLAWLAKSLHRFGRSLRAGDCIMTGSFTKPLPVERGARIRTVFDGIGEVTASFT